MDILLAPDVYVNASVAGAGYAPEQVVNRVLGNKKVRQKTTPWVLERVRAMLTAHPTFKKEAVEPQMKLISGLVEVVELKKDFAPDAWKDALVASAKATGAKRVITDHPDLADQTEVDGIEFLSSDAWMIEQQTPPPPPPPKK
ncbi:MAG TPA: hypothetical protein VIL20_23850 [Sandaracinaceae bacterium]